MTEWNISLRFEEKQFAVEIAIRISTHLEIYLCGGTYIWMSELERVYLKILQSAITLHT